MVSPHPLRTGRRVEPPGMVEAAEAHRLLGRVPSAYSAVATRCHARGPRPPSPLPSVTLVSSYAGKLRKLLLAIPNYVLLVDAFSDVYIALAKQLPDDTHFVILTHHKARVTVAGWFRRKGHAKCTHCRIVTVADEIAFSHWAEDPYVIGREASGRDVFIEPIRFDRGADGLIASLVAEEAQLDRTTSPLVFQGGNVLVGDDFYFVGVDYLVDSLHTAERSSILAEHKKKLKASVSHAIRTGFLDASRTVHFISTTQPVAPEGCAKIRIRLPDGTVAEATEHFHRSTRRGSMQPIYHIDMFITLVGREADGRFRILVGDPRLAAETAHLAELPKHAMVSSFDEIAQRLAAHREFVVTRTPLPYVYLDVVDKQPGKPTARRRWWYFASANNAIVENCGAGKRQVWLPTYGHGVWRKLQKTDALNQKIWQDLGFTVTMLPNCHAFAQNLGSVHCIKKYLAR